MNDEQLQRYARHIQLPQIGREGQQRLLDSTALVIGMGGLGSPAAMYLASAGVGRLIIADYDRVELSNLQRQIIHSTGDIDELKVESARRQLLAINPGVEVECIETTIDDELLEDWVNKSDVVVDCCDNFTTRFAANRTCHRYGKPLVSGACIQMVGQVSVFVPGDPESPCYRCLYKDDGDDGDACAQIGILAPVAGIIGCVQATEAIKVLLGLSTLSGHLLLLDALTMEWCDLRLPKDPACPVCGITGKSTTTAHALN
ncbi:MAG: HesA/MoeB/ThiF family protein [Gammaproteobacteria bacterium]